MSTHPSEYSSFSQIHRAIVQYSSTATGEIQVIIPSVTGNDTTVPISFFGRKEHPFENDWVVPNIGDTIIVCREDEDYTNTFWINTTYNPVRADVGEANPTAYHFGPHGSETGAFDLIDYAATPSSSGLFMGSVNMGYYNATASEWRTYMDYNGNFYLRGSGTNALTWNGSTLAVSGAITASTIAIGTSNTILKVDAAGNLSIGHDTPSSAPFQVSNAGAVTASNLTITGGQITGLNSTGINIGSGAFTVSSAGAVTASNLTVTGGQITGLNSTGISINGGVFAVTSAGALTATNATITGAISGGTIAGAAITAGTINVPASSPKFSVDADGNLTAVDGTFSGALSAGTITGDWEITSGELKIAATTDTGTTLTLKNDGTNAWLAADVAGQSGGYGGYFLVNKASDHANVQILAPRMVSSGGRAGITIKHYTSGVSSLNMGTSDEDPQIILSGAAAGTGTATIKSDDITLDAADDIFLDSDSDINVDADGVLYLRAPQISLATANTHHVFVDYNGIYLGNDSPAATAHRLYRSGDDLHWNGSAIGGGVTDHGALSGLGDNDHTQYSLTSHNHSGVYAASSHTHSYLPLTGGTLSGDLTLTGYRNVSATNSLYLRTNTSTTNITCYGGGSTKLHAGGYDVLLAAQSKITTYVSGEPVTDYQYTWGASGKKYSAMYAGAFNTTSDVNAKTDIQDATLGLSFVNALRPVTFKWKSMGDEHTSEMRAGVRNHQGFIAQEVETLLGDAAASTGLWINGYMPAREATDDGLEAEPESYNPGLRYDQFIPVLTKALQEISTKLDAAEARIAVLEST